MARKKRKTKRLAPPPKIPPPGPPTLTSSVQDEPSNQPKPTTSTPIPDSVKNECEQSLDPLCQENDDRIFFESSSGPQEKLANKQKNAELQKETNWFERFILVRKYWKTLSVEKKRSFLEVSFHDLSAHYASEDDKLAVDVISQAFASAVNDKTLKFWVCCSCSLEFNDCKSYRQHVWTHIENMAPKLWEIVPKAPDIGSIDMILSGCWKPVDLNAAVKILENQVARQSLTTADTVNQRWPLAEDPKRAKHLESIQSMFQLLLKHKCLADIHVKAVMEGSMSQLQKTATVLESLDHGLHKTLACICFLGADKLPNIFLYLHDLSKSCQLLGKDSEKTTSADDTHGVDGRASDLIEGIVLSDDSNSLILNEFLFAAGTVSSKAENAAPSEDGGPDWDEFLNEVFRPSLADVELASWTLDKSSRGMEIFEKLKKEFDLFQSFCKEKFKHQCYVEAFSELEDLCLEEVRKREHSVEYVAQSGEAILRQRHEEVAEIKDDPVLINAQREAISTVLEKYQASNVTSSNKEDLRMQENLHQVDERLVAVIGEQKELSSIKMSRLDARIRQKLATTAQLESELETISTYDYRQVLLLLVKKFLRARLEDLAEKDATEKSDVAREALLKELERETESNVSKGGDDSKQTQAKSKKKKKNYRRAKDLKELGREKEILSHQESEEQVSFGASDIRESEFVATNESVDDLKQLEDYLEADERKLEETLQYQRRIENEAKQKRFADKSVGSGLPKDSLGLHSGSVEWTEIPGPLNQVISEDVLSPHQWVDPCQEENETKGPGQLSAEEHDEERLKADLAKDIQESIEHQKIRDPSLKITAVRKYWNVLSVEKKLSLLSSVSDDDLWAYYEEDELVTHLLSEALSFRKSNKTCKFWACCLCGEKFVDCKSHNQHVWVHIGDPLPKLQPALPKEADSGWADMLLNGCWEPVDLHASMKILENRTTHESLTTVDDSDVGTRWPSVDDPERAKLLDGIHGMFQLLLKHKCLADTHLKKVIHYTMNELQGLAPGLQLLDHGLDQTPACIRFLDATQLQNVLDLLQELSSSCQLGRDSEKTTSADDTHSIDNLASDVLEGINLSDDSSHLISNEFRLTAVTNKAENAGMGDCMKASVISEGGLGGDAFLSWLFAFSDDLEDVSWILRREHKSRQGTEILRELEKEFNHLQKLCQEKCEHLCYMEAFGTLIDLCYEEFKKRHHSVEYVSQSFEALLRKRQEELVESKDNPVFVNSRLEENAISLVLKGEEALNVTDQCGKPGLTSHFCDLESSNKEEYSRMLDNLDQADESVLSGIRTNGSKFFLELCRLDARIMQNLDAVQQLERELGAMSSFDYREILFCLIRPLWRSLLEDLADKDAKEKADAAREL